MNRHDEDLHGVHSTLVKNSLPGAEILQDALDQMRAIRNGKEDHAILSFNAAYREIKEAIKRAAELNTSLTEPTLHDLRRAKKALAEFWPFLQNESDLDESIPGPRRAVSRFIGERNILPGTTRN